MRQQLLLCLLLRLGLILYSYAHDALLEVAYTDVDYLVFTNASRHLVAGGSPYAESEYRYSPLVAMVTAGNILLHSSFGKVVFATADVACGYVLASLSGSTQLANYWLWNPIVMTVSSRGNAEPLALLCVLATLAGIVQCRVVLAGAAFGIAVHMRAYPCIYLPSICLYILISMQTRGGIYRRVGYLMKFGLAAAASFGTITFTFYSMYGYEFLHAAYLYHLGRVDVQHNFSVYFYILRTVSAMGDQLWLRLVSRLAFVLQFSAILFFTLAVRQHLPTCWFLVTFAFVSLNKVITSQYFLWYLIFTPLLLARVVLSTRQKLMLSCVWFLPQCAWLGLAYLLEFRHFDVALYVWLASIVVLVANAFIAIYIYTKYRLGLSAKRR